MYLLWRQWFICWLNGNVTARISNLFYRLRVPDIVYPRLFTTIELLSYEGQQFSATSMNGSHLVNPASPTRYYMLKFVYYCRVTFLWGQRNICYLSERLAARISNQVFLLRVFDSIYSRLYTTIGLCCIESKRYAIQLTKGLQLTINSWRIDQLDIRY